MASDGLKEQATDFTIAGEVWASSDDDVGHARMRDKFELEIDEPNWVPIGNDKAPAPVDYLCVGVAGCQLEVLRQCLHKARIDDYHIHIRVEREHGEADEIAEPMPSHTSNRIGTIYLDLSLETTAEYEGRARQCFDVAEKACIVSRSVEKGIDIELKKDFSVTSD